MSEGFLLGGRVRHAQPAAGHRTGIEPVLLAASIAAKAGEHVLEGGVGSGAALLCLAARVPGVIGVGIELQPDLAALAAANFSANAQMGLTAMAGDLRRIRLDAAFHHAFANPPWHDPAGTASPDAAREQARRGAAGLLAEWASALAAPLRPRGSLTFVIAAAALPEAMAAFTGAGCGSLAVLPLWPKSGRTAKLALLQGRKGGRTAFRLLPGLRLHEPDGRYTPAAEAILRDGAALPFDGPG